MLPVFKNTAQDLLGQIQYASLSLREGFPYVKNFTALRKVVIEYHTELWDVQCSSVHPSEKQRSWQRKYVEFSDPAVHWKPAQTEAASLQSPGSNFSMYAVDWNQGIYLQNHIKNCVCNK